MDPSFERKLFSRRLRQALRDAKHPCDSPTRLAREFNVRFTSRPITIHAARKWLVGEAIPTQEKVRVLASWLGVSAESLRFGDGDPPMSENSKLRSASSTADIGLLADLQLLDENHRAIAGEMMQILLRVSGL